TLDVFTLPLINPEARRPSSPEWAYIGVYEDKLIGGYGFVHFSDLLQRKKAEYSQNEDFDKSASKGLVVMDRFTGDVLWKIDARLGFLHNGIAAANNILYCLDKLPPHIEDQLARRGKEPPNTYRLLALDVQTGKPVWEKNNDVFGSFLSYSEKHDILLQSTRPSRDTVRNENGKRIIAYKASNGAVLWDSPREYTTFPILHGDRIIMGVKSANDYILLNLLTGEQLDRSDPMTGENIPWALKRYYGCNYPLASEHLITFRSGSAGYFDFENNAGTGNFGGLKTGCTNSIIAADGVLNIPDYTRTCNCAYQNQTSIALVHMPDFDIETWTFNAFEWDGKPVRRTGINFGAPGDRLADNGTLWLDSPSIGGESPDLPVSTIPEKPDWYRYHSSRMNGEEYKWIAASGGKGLSSVRIILAQEPVKTKTYTVKLFFAEPDNIKPGVRVFDVIMQGKRKLKNFDIVKETDKPRTVLIKTFKNIKVDKELVIDFTAVNSSGMKPVISGIEIIAKN
ncbi:MAG: PQQ-binding-like beta-propeller repeat protein, partial [Candidatus Latescibacteria bacterium]|nr:PQQ-binding-like beta-propeller repeat protein [Candidatus Latescibacterota bacterium]